MSNKYTILYNYKFYLKNKNEDKSRDVSLRTKFRTKLKRGFNSWGRHKNNTTNY